MKKEEQEGCSMVLSLAFIVGVVFAIIVGVWVTKSHFEAKSFNSVTGKNVSTWEAMWIELRVNEPSKSNQE